MIEILIPHYGDEALLREAVTSVIDQSDARWHLTVMDDSPTDSVRLWVSGLPRDRITYEANPARLGVAGNFQRCLNRASSDWVVFMGCDDLLHDHYVARIHHLLDSHPEATAILPGVEVIDGSGVPYLSAADRVKRRLNPVSTGPTLLGGEPLLFGLMRGNWTYFPAMVWCREAIISLGFRQDLDTTLDLALLTELVLGGGLLLVDPLTSFSYRRHSASASSLTAANSERFLEEQRLFAELARKCEVLGWNRAGRAARVHLTSRMHAASLIPSAVRGKNGALMRVLARHALGGWR